MKVASKMLVGEEFRIDILNISETRVDLSKQNLKTISPTMLMNNKLMQLPNELGSLYQMREFHFEYNQLTSIPCSLFK